MTKEEKRVMIRDIVEAYGGLKKLVDSDMTTRRVFARVGLPYNPSPTITDFLAEETADNYPSDEYVAEVHRWIFGGPVDVPPNPVWGYGEVKLALAYQKAIAKGCACPMCDFHRSAEGLAAKEGESTS